MLSPLPVLPYGVDQTIIAGTLAYRLFGTVSIIKSVSMEEYGRWILGLYGRLNESGPNEAGLFCGFGQNCDEPDKWLFEMLRFFSRGRLCRKVAIEHYDELVERYDLKPFAKNVTPDQL